MVLKEKIRPSMKPYAWFKTLFHMHTRGMLYIIPGEKSPIDTLIGAYRVPEANSKYYDSVPKEEEGDNLYIAFYLPKDKPLPLGAVRRYLKNSDIKTIIRRDDENKVTIKSLRRGQNGRKR